MRCILIVFAAVSAIAQTAITPEQQRGSTGPAYRVVLIAPDGTYKQLELGTGLSIVDGRIVATAQALTPFTRRLAVAANGTYALPAGTETVTRNGLTIEEGEDYTLAGVILTPKHSWGSGDIVVARGRSAASPPVTVIRP